MWPGIPVTYQKLPESDSGSFCVRRKSRTWLLFTYQTPTRCPVSISNSEQVFCSECEKVYVAGDSLRLQSRASTLKISCISSNATKHHEFTTALHQWVECSFIGWAGQAEATDWQPWNSARLDGLGNVKNVNAHPGGSISPWHWWQWSSWYGGRWRSVSSRAKLVFVPVQRLELSTTIFHCVWSDWRHTCSWSCLTNTTSAILLHCHCC